MVYIIFLSLLSLIISGALIREGNKYARDNNKYTVDLGWIFLLLIVCSIPVFGWVVTLIMIIAYINRILSNKYKKEIKNINTKVEKFFNVD